MDSENTLKYNAHSQSGREQAGFPNQESFALAVTAAEHAGSQVLLIQHHEHSLTGCNPDPSCPELSVWSSLKE